MLQNAAFHQGLLRLFAETKLIFREKVQYFSESITCDPSMNILKPSSNWLTYILTLVKKVKHRVYKIHVFLSEAILCRDSASYFI